MRAAGRRDHWVWRSLVEVRYTTSFLSSIWRYKLADEKLYKADYVGSGTFIISKPKRKSGKLRQSRLKGRKAGMRK